MKGITAIIISYCSVELLKNCYNSIRKHHPTMQVLIVEGSPEKHECTKYAQTLENECTRVAVMNYNIGHGKGMHHALQFCNTKYALLIDSDTIMHQSPVEAMLQLMTPETYGVGEVVRSNEKGYNVTFGGLLYLHPWFALISVKQYFNYAPYIHHGAPCIAAMMDVNIRGNKSMLVNFPVADYVQHLGRGTRKQNPEEFKPNTWEKVATR